MAFEFTEDGAANRRIGTLRRNKRSVVDLEKLNEDDGTASLSDSSEHHVMNLDGQGSSFLFGANETPICLKREWNKLPMSAQEQATKDMYGINGETEITDETFLFLDEEIQNISGKVAYETAKSMSSSYVQDRRFLRMFLRACQGDAKKAAKRITRHFTTKEILFGKDKLVKDIELSDLDEYDMEALESGGFQVLPKRDLAGRNVLFGRYTAMRYRDINNMVSFTVDSIDCDTICSALSLIPWSAASAMVHMDVHVGRRSQPN
jgi:hypothetical protein